MENKDNTKNHFSGFNESKASIHPFTYFWHLEIPVSVRKEKTKRLSKWFLKEIQDGEVDQHCACFLPWKH